MKTPTGSPYQQSPHPNYPPTVPLYVYKELTKELQAIQAKLDAVTSQNQKLVQENKFLKQEFNQVIKSCLALQKLLNASPSNPSGSPSIPQVTDHSQLLDDPAINPHIHPEVKYYTPTPSPIRSEVGQNSPTQSQTPSKPLSRPAAVKKVKPPQKRPQTSPVPPMDMNLPVSENVFIEEEVRNSTHTSSSGLHTGWLILIIIFIMITGFSAGYLIVRPLLQNQTQTK